ncbi:hypothetical protein ACTGZQ_00825 [Streptococcus suis]
MTEFQYTDKQLNDLNHGKGVYSVNPAYATNPDNDFDIVTSKDTDQLNPGEVNTLTVGDQQFQVIATKSDPKTGFDGMAVAPIINGKPDYNHVAIIAAGTDPNSKDWRIPIYYAHQDGMQEPIVVEVKQSVDIRSAAIAKYTFLSPQYAPAEQFLRTVQEMPGVRVTKLSGYSQGAFVIKLGAKYGISTTTFNAWFDYSSLSPSEKQFLKDHPYMLFNYRKRKDNVVAWNDLNKPWRYYDDYGTIYWVDGSSHDIKDWYFDPVTGQLLDKEGGRPLARPTSYHQTICTMQMKQFETLKKRWKQSGGKLSSSEKIFLDAAQGQILASSMAQTARLGADEVKACSDSINQQVEELWSGIDFSSYRALAYYEVEALFASQGITYSQFVTEFQDYTQEKVMKMEEQATSFESLNTSIQAHIEEVVAADKKLAGEFKEWQTQM